MNWTLILGILLVAIPVVAGSAWMIYDGGLEAFLYGLAAAVGVVTASVVMAAGIYLIVEAL